MKKYILINQHWFTDNKKWQIFPDVLKRYLQMRIIDLEDLKQMSLQTFYDGDDFIKNKITLEIHIPYNQ